MISPFTSPNRWPPARSWTPSCSEADLGRNRDTDSDCATILAVDDESDALDFLEAFLVSEGFAFIRATSGAQALSLVEQRRPDLMIVDVMMAGMNGLELCEELRDRRDTRHLPIILYSAYDMKQHSNSGLYDHAFVKPADPDALLLAIHSLLPEAR